jgi:hypothetical protein
MYILASEGLGQDRDWLISEGVRKGHSVREQWSQCGREGTRQRRCGVFLGVPFRSSFADFRREVERALRDWMTPGRAAELVKKRERDLKAIHKKLLDDKMRAPATIAVVGTMTYRGPTNGEWRVTDIELH